jgi:hypothetical protein
MSEIVKPFKVNMWWKAALILGVAASGVALMFDIKILNEKYLFGLGLGLILIGMSCFIANKHVNIPYLGGMLSTEKLMHNVFTIIIFAIGTGITILFLTLLIIDLLH